IDWDKCLLTSDAYNPQVDFVADYRIDGKILLLPVRGSGKSNITMYDLKTHNEIHCEKYEKDGVTYIRVTKYDVKFTPKRVTLKFDNLFNGDTILGDQMNRFINENSDLLFKELQSPYEETFGLVFAKISNDFFSRIPFDKLFPQT
ncbi:take-out-like carrier protein, partial [Augochlora pura]